MLADDLPVIRDPLHLVELVATAADHQRLPELLHLVLPPDAWPTNCATIPLPRPPDG